MVRVLDSDAPGIGGPAAGEDVAAGVYVEAVGSGALQQLAGAVDGPALHEAGGVEVASRVRVEVAVCGRVELVAAGQYLADERVRLPRGQLPSVKARDLAVRPIGAE